MISLPHVIFLQNLNIRMMSHVGDRIGGCQLRWGEYACNGGPCCRTNGTENFNVVAERGKTCPRKGGWGRLIVERNRVSNGTISSVGVRSYHTFGALSV